MSESDPAPTTKDAMPNDVAAKSVDDAPKRRWPPSRFQIALVALLAFAGFMRFVNLARPAAIVFDEVYFAVFAENYLDRKTFFDACPPLAKYTIAAGIVIGEKLGPDDVRLEVGAAKLKPCSFRWTNAVLGTAIVGLAAALAWLIRPRPSFALLAGALVALDGLFLVESRYALTNVHLVFWGMLGHVALLKGCREERAKRVAWLVLAGIGFGGAASVKWNGAGYLLGALGAWACAFGWRIVRERRRPDLAPAPEPFDSLGRVSIPEALFFLGFAPFVFYSVVWIPHLAITGEGFFEIQKKIWDYHHTVGNTEHAYFSKWWTWPFLIRPVAYYWSQPKDTNLVTDVTAIGNPILWWLASGAIFGLVAIHASRLVVRADFAARDLEPPRFPSAPEENWTALYVVGNYVANLLPWVGVTRGLYLYHYMEAYLFALIALAWAFDRFVTSEHKSERIAAWVALAIVAAAFFWFLPIFIGIEMPYEGFSRRMWLSSWI